MSWKTTLYSVKNDAIKRMFPVLTYLYLFAFSLFSWQAIYTHLNAFIRLVKISFISRFEQGHVKSCSLTTKNIISPLQQCPWLPNLAWLILKSYYPFKYRNSLATWSSNITWQTETVILPLIKYPWLPKLSAWWFTITSSQP